MRLAATVSLAPLAAQATLMASTPMAALVMSPMTQARVAESL